MERQFPPWVETLDDEDLQFLRRFLLASGSLKALAKEYGISYPTVRGRLDRLIAKVRAAEEPTARDAFHRYLRALVAQGNMDRNLAERLLQLHFEAAGRTQEEMAP